MTLSEFKAWFEGYTEGLEAAPTKAQFDRIKEKVKEISGAPITQTVFLDRYRDYQRHWGQPVWYGGSAGYSVGSVGQGAGNAVLMSLGSVPHAAPQSARYLAGDNQTVEWDSHAAMYAVGKADAMSSAA